MTSDKSLATSSLNLPRRCMPVTLADPPSNPDANPLKAQVEKKCTFVRNLPIFAVKDEAFSRNTSFYELDVTQWFFWSKNSASIKHKIFIKICIPRIIIIIIII